MLSQLQKVIKDEGPVTRKVKVEPQTTVTTHQLVKNAIVSHNGNDSFTLCGQDQVDQATMPKNHEELRGAVCKVMYMDQPKKLHEVSSELGDASGELVFHTSPEQRERRQVADGASHAPTRPDPKKASETFIKNRGVTLDFLDSIRREESQENEARKIAKKNRCMIIKFSQVIETAETELNAAEEELELLYNAKSITIPGPTDEAGRREQHMEETLARANVQVASLVAANYADKLDYKAATEPIIALTKSVKNILDDGGMISSSLYENARKSFIDDLRKLCEAAKDICEAARSNKKKLNDVAILFGERSAKLLGVVNADVNPTLEMEVITRTEAISDTASRLALEASNVTSSTCNRQGDSPVQDICTAGARCVDAAGKLVYTAKLVAPTIHHTTCQDALVSSADSFSSSLTTFSDSWKALVYTQGLNAQKLTDEAGNLEALVEKLRNDVRTGKLEKRVEEEQLVAVDTPIRQMVAGKVAEEVNSRAANSAPEPLSYSATEACSEAVPKEGNKESTQFDMVMEKPSYRTVECLRNTISCMNMNKSPVINSENLLSQPATKTVVNEAARDLDYLQTNGTKLPVNEVLCKKVYVTPLGAGAPEADFSTETVGDADPTETDKESHVGMLMQEVDGILSPPIAMACEVIMINRIQITEEDNDNMPLCERQEVDRTETYSDQPADLREYSTEDAEENVSTLDSSASPAPAGASEPLHRPQLYFAPEARTEAVPEESNTERTYLGRLMEEIDETTRPKYECRKTGPLEIIQIIRIQNTEEDNDNMPLCERLEVDRTEKYSGQPADLRDCSTEDAEEYVSTLDSSASPEAQLDSAPELSDSEAQLDSAPELSDSEAQLDSAPELSDSEAQLDSAPELSDSEAQLDSAPELSGSEAQLDSAPEARTEAVPEESITDGSHLGHLMEGIDGTICAWYPCRLKETFSGDILNEEDNANEQLCKRQGEKKERKKTVKYSGQPADLRECSTEDAEERRKINAQEQFDTASKWLLKFTSKVEVKTHGQQAVRDIIYLANKITENLNKHEKEDMRRLITKTEQVLTECSKKYDQKKNSVLMELVRELKQGIERGVVTRVVEDFMEAEAPLADLDILADHETDERKRKFLLEKKVAELLAHLSRVIKTARLIADTDTDTRATVSTELNTCSDVADFQAAMLVKAAQLRVTSPNGKDVIEVYESVLARYAESLSKIRDLCDQSVDPMDFVRAAGVKIRLMREESTKHNDSMKWEQTSTAIAKLGHRVFCVGRSSSTARSDPELQDALLEVQKQLTAATPPADTCRMPDWKHTTAQILQATEEVESLLSGEYIFKKQPEPNHPIYNEAKNLHVAVRDWSSRDNEIVAVAKRMAVLMAKLADFMNNDKKREVLMTSRSIVTESHEVTRLAEKLAHKCTERRIKSNLLLACERIPTVSGQLKMLISVKASSFGRHGIREDKNAMDILVRNAQSLMLSIRDVVKGAESASVKIMSQRGPRMKWVRRNIY